MFFEKRHTCCVTDGIWEKLNLRDNSEDQQLISPLNSIIEEQSTKLGNDAVVIDGKFIDEIEKKGTLIIIQLIK